MCYVSEDQPGFSTAVYLLARQPCVLFYFRGEFIKLSLIIWEVPIIAYVSLSFLEYVFYFFVCVSRILTTLLVCKSLWGCISCPVRKPIKLCRSKCFQLISVVILTCQALDTYGKIRLFQNCA